MENPRSPAHLRRQSRPRGAYYDTISFAPDVKCPVYMNAGLIDFTSPATTVFAVYKELGSG